LFALHLVAEGLDHEALHEDLAQAVVVLVVVFVGLQCDDELLTDLPESKTRTLPSMSVCAEMVASTTTPVTVVPISSNLAPGTTGALKASASRQSPAA